jgi:hypothetical protein
LTHTFKDKNGAVELSQRGRVVVVVLAGACGTRLISYYARVLSELGQTYQGKPWAYLCNGKNFQATTPEAQKLIVEAYDSCIKLGCRYDAYCFDSPVGKAQTQKIMQDCGNPTDIEKILFETEQLAETYLSKKLAKLAAKTNHSDHLEKKHR